MAKMRHIFPIQICYFRSFNYLCFVLCVFCFVFKLCYFRSPSSVHVQRNFDRKITNLNLDYSKAHQNWFPFINSGVPEMLRFWNKITMQYAMYMYWYTNILCGYLFAYLVADDMKWTDIFSNVYRVRVCYMGECSFSNLMTHMS